MNFKRLKIIVIGLDGATWDLIKPWADKAELPTFKRLMENGVWGNLESTIPPVTCPAWPSMLTSKKPEKLGLYSFTYRDPESYKPKINKIRFNGSIWQVLDDYGKKCYVIGVPLSNLPKSKFNGVFIAGPIMNIGEITNQPRIKSLIEDIGYKVDIPGFEKDKEINHLKEVIVHSKKQFMLVKKLLDEDWDLLFYVNYATDPISHLYWKYLDETHPDHVKNEDIVLLIKRFYKEIDQFLALLVDKATYLFIVSDHGFGPCYWEINLNAWLAQEGFLKLKKPMPIKPAHKPARESVIEILKKLRALPLTKPFARKLAPFIIHDDGKSIFEKAPVLDFIDWEKTKAYSIYANGININLKGREPLGYVKSEEYESVRQEIIEKALEIKDPEGRKVVEKAWKVEELYESPSPTSFPDIVLKFKNFSKYRNKEDINLGLNNNVFTKGRYEESGSHTLYGIFLVYGPAIKKGVRKNNIKIYDIIPTILHILGLPILSDMDGRVLMEIFDSDSEPAKRNPIYVTPSYYKTKTEKEKIKARIRELKLKS